MLTENTNADLIANVEKKETAVYENGNLVAGAEEPKAKKKHSKSSTRFFKFLNLVWDIAEAFGYRVESRIKVTDIKTGKVWE